MNRIKISYIGDKPTISTNGIYFNHSKPDKYIYLQSITHILNVLQNITETQSKKIKEFNLSQKLSDSQILDSLYKVFPEFNEFYSQNIDSYERKIKAEEEEIKDNSSLSELDREILQNNYNLIFDYRIQRAKNKLVYESMINGAVKIIKEKRISLIKSLFTREFFHILQSIKTTLEREKNSPQITLQFIDEPNSDIEIELLIKFAKS